MTEDLGKFPVHYDVHKYLGRKPWYIVDEILLQYSRTGDTVLDLFSGSGVAAFEALRLNRNVIAIDYSPLSEIIVRALCEGCTAKEYHKFVLGLLSRLEKHQQLYRIELNGKKGIVRYWQPNQNTGKITFDDGSTYTGSFEKAKHVDFDKQLDGFDYDYSGIEFPKIAGNNVSSWDEIFSKRGAYILYHAFKDVSKVENEMVRRCLLVSLSAAIEKISLLNSPKASGKRWMRDKQSCYYKNDDFIEFNAVDAIQNKVTKMEDALIKQNKLLKNNKKFVFLRQRVEDLNYKNIADLVIMDPPYLDEVPYDRLEMLHDVWLGFSPPKQDIRYAFGAAAKKAYSALKTDAFLVLIMLNYLKENRDFIVGKLLEAGFTVEKEMSEPGRKKEGLTIVAFRKGETYKHPK